MSVGPRHPSRSPAFVAATQLCWSLYLAGSSAACATYRAATTISVEQTSGSSAIETKTHGVRGPLVEINVAAATIDATIHSEIECQTLLQIPQVQRIETRFDTDHAGHALHTFEGMAVGLGVFGVIAAIDPCLSPSDVRTGWSTPCTADLKRTVRTVAGIAIGVGFLAGVPLIADAVRSRTVVQRVTAAPEFRTVLKPCGRHTVSGAAVTLEFASGSTARAFTQDGEVHFDLSKFGFSERDLRNPTAKLRVEALGIEQSVDVGALVKYANWQREHLAHTPNLRPDFASLEAKP